MSDLAALMLDQIDAAEAEALARHQAGTCHESEWSCSHCEAAAQTPASDWPAECPSWCVVDHDAEAALQLAENTREGIDLSFDPDTLLSPCVGAGLTAQVNDGRKVGARPVLEVHEQVVRLDVYIVLPDGRQEDLGDPLTLVEAQALAAILTTLADRHQTSETAA